MQLTFSVLVGLAAALLAPAAWAQDLDADILSRNERSALTVTQDYEPSPAIWKLADEDTTIYLFGTFHLLPDGFLWRSPELDGVVEEADELVELRVAAVQGQGGVVDDLDIGIDAVALDEPLTLGIVEGERGHGDAAAVDENRRTADADQPDPGTGTDQRAGAGLLEEVGKEVAARAGPVVDQHDHGTWARSERGLLVEAVARCEEVARSRTRLLGEREGWAAWQEGIRSSAVLCNLRSGESKKIDLETEGLWEFLD